MNIAIVAGGKLHESFVPHIGRSEKIIGVDRGALWLIRQGIVPDIAIGDFDSVSPSELREIKTKAKSVKQYPAQKDKTDLELALDESIRLRPREIVIFGAIGRRVDHLLAAIGLLLKLESHNIYGQIVDNFNTIYIVRHQKHFYSSSHAYVSIIPLDHHAIITLSGFAYNVSKLKLLRVSTRGISNEIKDSPAILTVHHGSVLVIASSDKRPIPGQNT